MVGDEIGTPGMYGTTVAEIAVGDSCRQRSCGLPGDDVAPVVADVEGALRLAAQQGAGMQDGQRRWLGFRRGVADALAKVGYRPTVVADAGDLARQLREGRWDLVLVDLVDATALPAAFGTALAPAVVTVAYDTSGPALAQARRSYDGVIKKPGRSRAVVDAVDDALFARALRPSAGTKASN